MVKKKPPVKKPPLLSFLLREFSGRSFEKKQERAGIPDWFLEKTRVRNFGDMTSLLLSPLLRFARKRIEPEEEKEEKEEDKKILRLSDDDQEEEEDNMKGRFEVLPTKGIEEDYKKRAFSLDKKGEKPAPSGDPRRVTGDNYRQMYLEQRETENVQQKTAENEKLQSTKDNDKEIAEKKMADDKRFRARELQNQIAWWNGQKGLGQYDDATIGSTVDNLQRELSGIPQGLWG